MDLRTENKYMMFLIKVMFDKLLDWNKEKRNWLTTAFEIVEEK